MTTISSKNEVVSTDTFLDCYGHTIAKGSSVFVCYNIVTAASADKKWLTGTVVQVERDKRTVKILFDGEQYSRNAMKEQVVWADSPEVMFSLIANEKLIK